MRSRIGVQLGLLILLAPPVVLAGQNSPPPIPNSTNGFDKQYKNLFKAYEKAYNPSKAYKKENELKLVERFGTFAIPERWFNDVFGPEQGPTFARQYSELFKGFQFSTMLEFNIVLGSLTAQVKTKGLRANQVDPLRSAQTSLVTLPPVQLFRVQHFTAPFRLGRDTFSEEFFSHTWGGILIYLDGAFRFVGSRDCPFWRSCSTNDPVFEGFLGAS
jgi:hypothetical protein